MKQRNKSVGTPLKVNQRSPKQRFLSMKYSIIKGNRVQQVNLEGDYNYGRKDVGENL